MLETTAVMLFVLNRQSGQHRIERNFLCRVFISERAFRRFIRIGKPSRSVWDHGMFRGDVVVERKLSTRFQCFNPNLVKYVVATKMSEKRKCA